MRRTFTLTALAAAAVAVLAAPAFALTSSTPGTLVKDRALACTPQINTGNRFNVGAILEPSTVFMGGIDSTIVDCHGTTFKRSNAFAYNALTGAVLPFLANTDGQVRSMTLSLDGKSLYMGGDFRHVNGVAVSGLAKVDSTTGKVDTAFRSAVGGHVYTLTMTPDGRLLAGGSFTGELAALNARSGADTGTVRVSFAGDLDPKHGPARVDKIGLNPAGNDLVIVGNWETVNGQLRHQAARLTLTATAATLTPWHPARFNGFCPAFPLYLRNVAWSPDGTYFVMVSTGGGTHTAGFCDSAGRWDATTTSPTYEPAWMNVTGADSLYSVAVDSDAHRVYVAGHNRWLDNPQGQDNPGPGAFRVDSIGAINTDTGKADRAFTCVGCSREHGKEWLGLGSFGLVEASDGHTVTGVPHYGTAVFPK